MSEHELIVQYNLERQISTCAYHGGAIVPIVNTGQPYNFVTINDTPVVCVGASNWGGCCGNIRILDSYNNFVNIEGIPVAPRFSSGVMNGCHYVYPIPYGNNYQNVVTIDL